MPFNKGAHECLSEAGVHRFFAPHRIRTGNGAELREFVLLMETRRRRWEGSNL